MPIPIKIDTTLISGVISAAVAVLVACGTVIWTTKSNRKLEKEKLLNEKTEALVNELELLRHSLSKNFLIEVKEASMSPEEYFKTKVLNDSHIQEITTLNGFARCKLLCNLYFKDQMDNFSKIEKLNDKYIEECIKIRKIIHQAKTKNIASNINYDSALLSLNDVKKETEDMLDGLLKNKHLRKGN